MKSARPQHGGGTRGDAALSQPEMAHQIPDLHAAGSVLQQLVDLADYPDQRCGSRFRTTLATEASGSLDATRS